MEEKLPFFMKTEIWPCSNPDFNLLEREALGEFQSKLKGLPHISLAFLKSTIKTEAQKLD